MEWTLSRPGRFTTKGTATGTHRPENMEKPHSRLERWYKDISLNPVGNRPTILSYPARTVVTYGIRYI